MKLRAALTVLILGGVALTACGGDATTTTGVTSTSSEASTTTVTSATTTSEATTTTATTVATSTTIEGISVSVFFSVGDGTDCAEVAAYERSIPAADPIAEALEQLVGGPIVAEESAGASSFFNDASADSIRSVDLVDGLLTVDFRDFRALLSNASTSCGSEAFLSSLNATVFQFGEVEQVRYTIFGSCGTFYSWLQRDCQDQTRTGPVAVELDTNEEAFGSGCMPDAAVMPDGDWFGYIDSGTGTSVEFDLACWFSGIAAADAAAEDGSESPPPNDYYIRNESDTLRTVPVSAAATVEKLDDPGGPDLIEVGYDTWSAGWASLDYQPGVWLTIEGGEIVHILEQYVP